MTTPNLFPSHLLPPLPTWQVFAYDGKGKCLGRPVYCRAGSKASAEKLGRALHKFFGQRGRFTVAAFPYSPLRDPAFSGYVRALPEVSEK